MLSDGLTRVGRVTPRKPVALGGNFDLIDVQDLVAKRSLPPGEPFTALGLDVVTRELERLSTMADQPLTIRFLACSGSIGPGPTQKPATATPTRPGCTRGNLLRAVEAHRRHRPAPPRQGRRPAVR